MTRTKGIKTFDFDAIALAFYALLLIISLHFHECWRDEAQAWLIARDLNVRQIIAQLKYEGHFLPWFLLLMPWAKLQLPLWFANLVSTTICFLSGLLVVKFAPFKRWVCYLFLLSSPMLYWFAVFARPYCLIPLSLTLLAIFYPQRQQKPWRYLWAIIFLVNTHLIMLGLASVLLLEFFLNAYRQEKTGLYFWQKWWRQLLLTGGALFVSGAPLLDSLSASAFAQVNAHQLQFQPFSLLQLIGNFCSFAFGFWLNNSWVHTGLIALVIVCFLGELILFGRRTWLLFVPLVWQFALFSLLVSGNSWRYLSIIWLVFFYQWLKVSDRVKSQWCWPLANRLLKAVWLFLLVINVGTSIIQWCQDINYLYSDAGRMADFITYNLTKDDMIIIAVGTQYFASVIAQTPIERRYFALNVNDNVTFTTWDENYLKTFPPNLLDHLQARFGFRDDLYLLYHQQENNATLAAQLVQANALTPIFTSDFGLVDEQMSLYKINLATNEAKQQE